MWLIPDQLSSRFSAASGGSTLRCVSSCPDAALFVTSSGTPTRRPYSWPAWKTRVWSQRLFGAATCAPSIGGSIGGWWISSLQALPASLIAWQASVPATPTTGATAQTAAGPCPPSPDSLPPVSPPWSSSKTFQLGFEMAGFDNSATNYAEWVTRSKNRSSSLRQMLAQATNASGCSSLPTPDCNTSSYSNGRMGPNLLEMAVRWDTPDTHPEMQNTGSNRTEQVAGLGNQAKAWQTPGTDSFRCRGGDRKDEMGLDQQARLWATPRGHMAGPDFAKATRSKTGMELQAQAENWPSPRAEDSESCGNHPNATDSLTGAITNWPTPKANEKYQSSAAHEKGFFSLQETTENWPTPKARDVKGMSQRGEHQPGDALENMVTVFQSSHPAPTAHLGQKSSHAGPTLLRRLNPTFDCWLMGAPWFWTRAEPISCGAQATASWLCKARWRLRCYWK